MSTTIGVSGKTGFDSVAYVRFDCSERPFIVMTSVPLGRNIERIFTASGRLPPPLSR